MASGKNRIREARRLVLIDELRELMETMRQAVHQAPGRAWPAPPVVAIRAYSLGSLCDRDTLETAIRAQRALNEQHGL